MRQSEATVILDLGAKAMLDALVRLGAVRLDHDLQAVLPGQPVGMEMLTVELERAGVRLP